MIKMIVMDLDGSILNSQKKVSLKTKKYLNDLKKAGYIIAIATGRTYESAIEALDNGYFISYMITNTGACLYQDGKLLFKKYLDKEILIKIFDKYQDYFTYMNICCDSGVYRNVEANKQMVNQFEKITQVSLIPLNNDVIDEIYVKLLQENYPIHLGIMQNSFGNYKWLEITDFNVSKYLTILRLANILKINNEEIMAFGDGLNDLEMIKETGYGVALCNALKEVQEVARDITQDDNDHDGILKYLQKFLK